MITLMQLNEMIQKQYPQIELLPARPDSFYFEKRVLMNCFYCKNYNLNWKCPPRIPDIDYQKMFMEFDNGAFVKLQMPLSPETFQEVRTRSTNTLHHAMLELEKILWEHDHPAALSFIGGSCKLCKDGCGTERCRNPYLARIPLEATGVNVLKTVEEQTGIHITFPPKEHMVRIGLLLW